MEKREAIDIAIRSIESRNNVIAVAKRRLAIEILRTILPPNRFVAIPCQCGWRNCKKYQVSGIAPEAKFTQTQAIAVARVLNELPDD